MEIESGIFYSKDASLYSIWNDHTVYVITNYQRPYVWTTDQASAVIEDIDYLRKHPDQTVAWPAILVQDYSLPEGYKGFSKCYLVGDGQQRLTTVFLGLLAIWQTVMRLDLSDPTLRQDKGKLERFIRLSRIVPSRSDLEGIIPGILGSLSLVNGTLDYRPKLIFRDEEFNSSVQNLFSILTTKDETELAIKMRPESRTANFHRVYRFFRDRFEQMSFDELYESFELLKERIKLPVSIYSRHENMLRSFANMNSKGVSLSEADLVKASIFAKAIEFRNGDEMIANFIDFWNSKLDYGRWSEEVKSAQLTQEGVKHTHLTRFILEYYHYKTKWSILRGRKQDYKVGHWLRDSFQSDVLDPIKTEKEFSLFLEDFEAKSKLYASWNLDDRPRSKGSLDWYLCYAKQMFKASYVESTFFAIIDEPTSDREKKEIVKVLIEWNLYRVLTGDALPRKGFNVILDSSKSPFVSPDIDLSVKEIYSFLASGKGKRLWMSKTELFDYIRNSSYNSKFHNGLLNVFIYVQNKSAEKENVIINLYDPREFFEKGDKPENRATIEHILSQKPEGYDDWPTKEREKYDFKKKRLGNLMPLMGNVNSQLQNKEVSEKIPIYREIQNEPWGHENRLKLLEIWERAQTWDSAQIEERTIVLATIFARHFSIPSEYVSKASLEGPRKSGAPIIGDSDNVTISEDTLKSTWLAYLKVKLSNPIFIDRADESIKSGKRLFSVRTGEIPKNFSEINGFLFKDNPSKDPKSSNYIVKWIEELEGIFGIAIDYEEIE